MLRKRGHRPSLRLLLCLHARHSHRRAPQPIGHPLRRSLLPPCAPVRLRTFSATRQPQLRSSLQALAQAFHLAMEDGQERRRGGRGLPWPGEPEKKGRKLGGGRKVRGKRVNSSQQWQILEKKVYWMTLQWGKWAAKSTKPAAAAMAPAGALHAGSRHLLPLRRSSSAPWSHVRSHLLSSKPLPSPPPPPSSATASRFTPTFVPPSRRRGAVRYGAGVVEWYLGSLEARPVLTKSITAAAIFTVADLSSQMITLGPEDSLDLVRTLRMASYGLLISGPSLHLWFNFVSKVFPKKDVVNTFKKMFLGQAVYGPIINSVFFSYNAGLQGETIPEIIARLKRDLIPTIKSGLVYWPLCDFITFKFIPVHLQPLVSNAFSFLWTIYITYMASLKKADVEVAMSS